MEQKSPNDLFDSYGYNLSFSTAHWLNNQYMFQNQKEETKAKDSEYNQIQNP